MLIILVLKQPPKALRDVSNVKTPKSNSFDEYNIKHVN